MNLLSTWKTNPEALLKRLAEHRVRRGIKWLDEHAPDGWWLRLFALGSDGRWRFFAVDCLGNRCVLALAFQTRADLANEDGYVTFGTVSNHFRLWKNNLDKKLGFFSDRRISSNLLDATWGAVLPEVVGYRTFHGPLRHPPRPMSEESMRALEFSLRYMATHGISLNG